MHGLVVRDPPGPHGHPAPGLRHEHLRVHLVDHLQLLDHVLVVHHVGVQDGLNGLLPRLLVLLLGQHLEAVGLRVLHDGVELRAVHVLQRRLVVVLHGQLVARLREEAIVHAGVAQVVAERRDEERVLLELREEEVGAHHPEHLRDPVDHVHCVGEAVEGVRGILLLATLHKLLQRLVVARRADEALALSGVVEVRDCIDRCRVALRVREGEGREGPGREDLLTDANVLELDLVDRVRRRRAEGDARAALPRLPLH
mmetsp:Transcript_68695/g.212383  ORF Transcript_68695/g.212383 Transcript_68695/m.212383 type:complete len:256 (+) Transcript_68695:489-1256(+)